MNWAGEREKAKLLYGAKGLAEFDKYAAKKARELESGVLVPFDVESFVVLEEVEAAEEPPHRERYAGWVLP